MRMYLTTIFLFIVIILSGCAGIDSDNKRSASKVDSVVVPDSKFYGTTHYIYEGGQVIAKVLTDSTWSFELNDSTVAWVLEVFVYDSLDQVTSVLTADSGLIRRNHGEFHIYSNLEADYFDSLGNSIGHLVGDSGIIIEKTGVLHIYENVVGTMEDGQKIETDYLRWDLAKNIIDTDAFVKRTDANGNVNNSHGIIIDQDFKRIRQINKISGTLIQKEK